MSSYSVSRAKKSKEREHDARMACRPALDPFSSGALPAHPPGLVSPYLNHRLASHLHTPALSPLASPSGSSFPSLPAASSYPATPSPLALSLSTSSISSAASATSTPSVSAAIHNETRQAKRARTGEVSPEPTYFEVVNPDRHWSVAREEEWRKDLCLLFVACNIAWWTVEHPFARAFFHKWVPGSTLPGRNQLSGTVLDGEAQRVVNKMMEKVEGRFGTGQCDGWKNISKTSLVASMVNVEYKVRDVTDPRGAVIY